MATKNLKKTIIEGGRTREYKETRRAELRAERRRARQKLQEIARDPDLPLEEVGPLQKDGRLESKWVFAQKDKLNPLNRYLDKQVGRPWSLVFSEIIRRFDGGIKGYHLIHDHVIEAIPGAGGQEGGPVFLWHTFYVDEYGIFRKNSRERRAKRVALNADEKKRILSFLGKRKVRMIGKAVAWVLPTGKDNINCFFGPFWSGKRPELYYYDKKWGHTLRWEKQAGSVYVPTVFLPDGKLIRRGYYKPVIKSGTFRAGKKLNRSEMRVWLSFSKEARELMIERSGWTPENEQQGKN